MAPPRASERGLWHDWWVSDSADVAHGRRSPGAGRRRRRRGRRPSGSHHATLRHYRPRAGRLTITIDVTWLGPYETGAQVLTTAALDALALHDGVTEIRLVGLDELPAYARHLARHPNVRVDGPHEQPPVSDVVWYPNQIDGRSNIAAARRMGARGDDDVSRPDRLRHPEVPRLTGGLAGLPFASAAHRPQRRRHHHDQRRRRRTALAMEVPRLEPERVLALPLGLDHITRSRPRSRPTTILPISSSRWGGRVRCRARQ